MQRLTRQREAEDDDGDEKNNHTMKSPSSAAAAALLVLIEDKNLLCSSASEIRVRMSASEGERVDGRYEVVNPDLFPVPVPD